MSELAGRSRQPRRQLYPALMRFGVPVWAWRTLTWTTAAVGLVLLFWHNWAFVFFFVVFPLLWLVHGSFRAAAVANLVYGAGIAVAGSLGRDLSWLPTAVISVAFSMLMGLWMQRVQIARVRAVEALAAKEEALAAKDEALAAKDEALAALAKAQEELAAAEREAGMAAERQRWAREVHDTLAQGFVSVVALAQAARAEYGGGGVDGATSAILGERLKQIEDIARENLAEARALVAGEGPSALQGAGLGEALERLAASSQAHGLDVHLRAELPEGLTPALQVVVLRVVQEALSNVVRHAQAEHACVDVAAVGGELVMTVGDFGVGHRAAPEGTGLAGMRSRVEAFGGTLTVDPLHPPDEHGHTGTLLEARLPL